MISASLVQKSVIFSLLVQISTGLVQLYALFLNIPKEHDILQSILATETLVQFVEAMFYIWLAYGLYKMKDVTATRYYDWVITTPMMLLATIVYFKYLEKTEYFTFFEFVESHKENIMKIFALNWAMLLFGYLGETKKMNLFVSVCIGFVFFGLLFNELYQKYTTTPEAFNLFTFLIIVWSLYGVAAVMSTNLKNLMYNILDIVSKNFYGLFIFYKVLQVAK